MAVLDNRPVLADLLSQLSGLPQAILDKLGPPDYTPLVRLLNASIAHVEDVATTALNSVSVTELYDGNGTNQIVLRKRPVLSVADLRVVTPILGYTRVYTQAELKVYRKQGVLKVFTYKLAVEQALLTTVDYQAWGHLFPPLPQCVQVTYTYGYPRYDDAGGGQTSLDGGVTFQPGDLRDPEEENWLTNLQQAAVADAAASVLAQSAGLQVGLLQSVSFDGYSKSLNPAAFGAQVQSLIAKRDELLARRKRQFYMSTVG